SGPTRSPTSTRAEPASTSPPWPRWVGFETSAPNNREQEPSRSAPGPDCGTACDRQSLSPTFRDEHDADASRGLGMYRRPVESSLIRSVGYDLASSVLEIEFREPHRLYQYFDVPLSVYSMLMAAESKGAYFNEYIRDMYTYQESDEDKAPSPD